jgi:hypothetical protein
MPGERVSTHNMPPPVFDWGSHGRISHSKRAFRLRKAAGKTVRGSFYPGTSWNCIGVHDQVAKFMHRAIRGMGTLVDAALKGSRMTRSPHTALALLSGSSGCGCAPSRAESCFPGEPFRGTLGTGVLRS